MGSPRTTGQLGCLSCTARFFQNFFYSCGYTLFAYATFYFRSTKSFSEELIAVFTFYYFGPEFLSTIGGRFYSARVCYKRGTCNYCFLSKKHPWRVHMESPQEHV